MPLEPITSVLWSDRNPFTTKCRSSGPMLMRLTHFHLSLNTLLARAKSDHFWESVKDGEEAMDRIWCCMVVVLSSSLETEFC